MVRVLIVDDKPEIRLLLKAAVEREGHSAIVAASAEQAWDMLDQQPDVMFADIGLPGEDGIAFTARVRRRNFFGDLPVVFVTARSNAEKEVRAAVAEPVSVLEKPFRFDQVAQALRDIRTRRREY